MRMSCLASFVFVWNKMIVLWNSVWSTPTPTPTPSDLLISIQEAASHKGSKSLSCAWLATSVRFYINAAAVFHLSPAPHFRLMDREGLVWLWPTGLCDGCWVITHVRLLRAVRFLSWGKSAALSDKRAALTLTLKYFFLCDSFASTTSLQYTAHVFGDHL